MGHSSSIALGIALERKGCRVFCLDGDGAFIMHMGGLSTIGDLAPANYKHILFNNGAHESVGGQPTLAFQLDIPAIAKACGYKDAIVAVGRDEIEDGMKTLMGMEGPVLLEVKVRIDSRDDLGRPTATTIENKERFMEFLDTK